MLGTLLISAIIFTDADSLPLRSQNLDEVDIVSGTTTGRNRSVKGQAAGIDEHISVLRNVNMVRRGSYAWEPVVNNMQTERLSTTIDGMKIFYACTDKMDPVTSYVESGNLQSISLNSGLNGNPQATGNIGGSLDLRLRKAGFDAQPFRLNVLGGHEWNGHLQVYGADAALSGSRAYANLGAFRRDADCYNVGGGSRLQFSQFHKINLFSNLGFRLSGNDILEGTVIFDRATDVGYPALNMDVSTAQGLITSVSYRHLFSTASWETKAYYNHIIHIMDDTTRPDVAIHMDMPGDSWTTGLYSLLLTSFASHDIALNYDLYYNRLFADMTMYPGGAAPMYMVTWPDVGTLNTGLALTDDISISSRHNLHLSAKVAWQQQKLNNEEGYHAQKVFFPMMKDYYHQTTGRVAALYSFAATDNLGFSAGTGWGSRAPTVTEAYGYYLNNTYDQYDYIGNPTLKNESAIELNASADFRKGLFSVGADANIFLFSNYIIGHFEPRLSAMTVGAEGVKVYGNLKHATIANLSLTGGLEGRFVQLSGKVSYSRGRDNQGDALPLIAPITWQTDLDFAKGPWSGQIEVKGNGRQKVWGQKYGETASARWTILNLSAQYRYRYLTVRAGVENLLDKYYATYADWNDIPQKGRNIYVNLTIEI